MEDCRLGSPDTANLPEVDAGLSSRPAQARSRLVARRGERVVIQCTLDALEQAQMGARLLGRTSLGARHHLPRQHLAQPSTRATLPLRRRVQDTCTRSGVDTPSAGEEQSSCSLERQADGEEQRYLYNIEMYKILRNRIVNTGTRRESSVSKDECHKVPWQLEHMLRGRTPSLKRGFPCLA